jgi:integrase
MASVFKRGRWVDGDGRKCAKGTPGAKWVESRFYTVQVFIEGKPKFVKGYTDKGASEQLGAKLERAKAQGEQGLVDPFKQHRRRRLSEHVGDWIAELRQIGRDDMYIAPCKARLQRLADECGWKVLGEISADAFCKWRENAVGNADHNRKDKATRTVSRLSPRAKNHYLATVNTFCRWCVKRKRMASNPVADIEKVDETADVRRERRALTADELVRLLDAVPEHYRLGYQVLMGTGLRREELLALRWDDVKLNAPHPFIQLRAVDTKSKRADVLPLRADLAELLRKAKGEADQGDRVVRVLPRVPTHRKYLAAAGIPWLDDAGRRADLHALRHSYGTLLSKGGVSPREAMYLMRHTDLRLTMKVYTDPRIFDLAGAVEKLPMTFGTVEDAEAAPATGTDGNATADEGDPDVVGAQLFGGGVAQSIQSPLGGGVGSAVGEGVFSGEGGDVDDVSAAGAEQQRRESVDAIVHAAQIGVEDVVPGLRRELVERAAEATDAGVVHQNVQASEGFVQARGGSLD